ncbi:cytoplasmic protein [Chelativorans salis]|uniref:Cytoplasmic protein n=1 Tax=Chelativorans salis TaxID=2978478 RepID=A0ABT2LN30_9HYPH|nr:cytoplasmic protein [Chelativorans sp. EGI FJ00035]MCT7375975.1 cytoplasmic protein [Chelativorans sp. EGI FJ00035]
MPTFLPPAFTGRPFVVALAVAGLLSLTAEARALSEALPEYASEEEEPGAERILLPGAEPSSQADDQPTGDVTRPDTRLDEASPEVIYDLDQLPEPVRRMRNLIIEASRSGDLEKLRPLIGTGPEKTQLSLGGLDGDPIDFLREVSGDEKGHEILAILLEVMEAGFARLDEGTERERYVWPYFFALPLEELTPEQRVELFTLVTAGDYEDMKAFGAYIFYRAAITPEGRWLFFVAGD